VPYDCSWTGLLPSLLRLTLTSLGPPPVGLLSPSHYASLQLPLPLEDGSSTSAPLPKLDVRKVNAAKLSPKEARAVKLVEVAAAPEPKAPNASSRQDDTPAAEEPKREDEWLEICLKQALGASKQTEASRLTRRILTNRRAPVPVDLRYLTPATTVSVELPDTTRTFRLTEVDGESVSAASPAAAEVDGLAAKLDRLDVNGAAGKRAADQLWIVGWTLQLETEQLERTKPASAEKSRKDTTSMTGSGHATGSGSVRPVFLELKAKGLSTDLILAACHRRTSPPRPPHPPSLPSSTFSRRRRLRPPTTQQLAVSPRRWRSFDS
jgi:hypothetical protein